MLGHNARSTGYDLSEEARIIITVECSQYAALQIVFASSIVTKVYL